MMTNDTIRKLNELKLFGMAHAFDEQLSSPSMSHLSFGGAPRPGGRSRIDLQRQSTLAASSQGGQLRESAARMEDIEYRADRGLDRLEMASFGLCTWIKRGMNLIITGATGNGKTWLACALGNQACRHGPSVSFQRISLLLEELAISHADGTFRKRLIGWPKSIC